MNTYIRKATSIVIIAAFLITQCGLGFAAPAPQNLRAKAAGDDTNDARAKAIGIDLLTPDAVGNSIGSAVRRTGKVFKDAVGAGMPPEANIATSPKIYLKAGQSWAIVWTWVNHEMGTPDVIPYAVYNNMVAGQYLLRQNFLENEARQAMKDAGYVINVAYPDSKTPGNTIIAWVKSNAGGLEGAEAASARRAAKPAGEAKASGWEVAIPTTTKGRELSLRTVLLQRLDILVDRSYLEVSTFALTEQDRVAIKSWLLLGFMFRKKPSYKIVTEMRYTTLKKAAGHTLVSIIHPGTSWNDDTIKAVHEQVVGFICRNGLPYSVDRPVHILQQPFQQLINAGYSVEMLEQPIGATEPPNGAYYKIILDIADGVAFDEQDSNEGVSVYHTPDGAFDFFVSRTSGGLIVLSKKVDGSLGFMLTEHGIEIGQDMLRALTCNVYPFSEKPPVELQYQDEKIEVPLVQGIRYNPKQEGKGVLTFFLDSRAVLPSERAIRFIATTTDGSVMKKVEVVFEQSQQTTDAAATNVASSDLKEMVPGEFAMATGAAMSEARGTGQQSELPEVSQAAPEAPQADVEIGRLRDDETGEVITTRPKYKVAPVSAVAAPQAAPETQPAAPKTAGAGGTEAAVAASSGSTPENIFEDIKKKWKELKGLEGDSTVHKERNNLWSDIKGLNIKFREAISVSQELSDRGVNGELFPGKSGWHTIPPDANQLRSPEEIKEEQQIARNLQSQYEALCRILPEGLSYRINVSLTKDCFKGWQASLDKELAKVTGQQPDAPRVSQAGAAASVAVANMTGEMEETTAIDGGVTPKEVYAKTTEEYGIVEREEARGNVRGGKPKYPTYESAKAALDERRALGFSNTAKALDKPLAEHGDRALLRAVKKFEIELPRAPKMDDEEVQQVESIFGENGWLFQIRDWVDRNLQGYYLPAEINVGRNIAKRVITELDLPINFARLSNVKLTPEWDVRYGYVIKVECKELARAEYRYLIAIIDGKWLSPIAKLPNRQPHGKRRPRGTMGHLLELQGPLDLNAVVGIEYSTYDAGEGGKDGTHKVKEVEIAELPTSKKRIRVPLTSTEPLTKVRLDIDGTSLGRSVREAWIQDPADNRRLATVLVDLTDPVMPNVTINKHIIPGVGGGKGMQPVKDKNTRLKEGEELKQLRQQIKANQKDLGELISSDDDDPVSPAVVSNWEHGRSSVPDWVLPKVRELAHMGELEEAVGGAAGAAVGARGAGQQSEAAEASAAGADYYRTMLDNAPGIVLDETASNDKVLIYRTVDGVFEFIVNRNAAVLTVSARDIDGQGCFSLHENGMTPGTVGMRIMSCNAPKAYQEGWQMPVDVQYADELKDKPIITLITYDSKEGKTVSKLTFTMDPRTGVEGSAEIIARTTTEDAIRTVEIVFKQGHAAAVPDEKAELERRLAGIERAMVDENALATGAPAPAAGFGSGTEVNMAGNEPYLLGRFKELTTQLHGETSVEPRTKEVIIAEVGRLNDEKNTLFETIVLAEDRIETAQTTLSRVPHGEDVGAIEEEIKAAGQLLMQAQHELTINRLARLKCAFERLLQIAERQVSEIEMYSPQQERYKMLSLAQAAQALDEGRLHLSTSLQGEEYWVESIIPIPLAGLAAGARGAGQQTVAPEVSQAGAVGTQAAAGGVEAVIANASSSEDAVRRLIDSAFEGATEAGAEHRFASAVSMKANRIYADGIKNIEEAAETELIENIRMTLIDYYEYWNKQDQVNVLSSLSSPQLFSPVLKAWFDFNDQGFRIPEQDIKTIRIVLIKAGFYVKGGKITKQSLGEASREIANELHSQGFTGFDYIAIISGEHKGRYSTIFLEALNSRGIDIADRSYLEELFRAISGQLGELEESAGGAAGSSGISAEQLQEIRSKVRKLYGSGIKINLETIGDFLSLLREAQVDINSQAAQTNARRYISLIESLLKDIQDMHLKPLIRDTSPFAIFMRHKLNSLLSVFGYLGIADDRGSIAEQYINAMQQSLENIRAFFDRVTNAYSPK